MIVVNGVALEVRHVMTVRVALSSFASDLQTRGLGTDEHGLAMTKGYLAAIADILRWMEEN